MSKKKKESKKKLKSDLKNSQTRKQIEENLTRAYLLKTQRDTVERFYNSGYSHGGASRSDTWAKEYHSDSLSAVSDIEENRKLLRERTRDLYMNAPLGSAAINSVVTGCVGVGMEPKPKIDYDFLGITKEEAVELQSQIKREFGLWADKTFCDANDQNNFYELQQIIFSEWLKNGEGFALIKYEESTTYMPYQLRIKLVEADRICDVNSMDSEFDGMEKYLENGNRVINGVEIEPSGKVVAYYICSGFPGEYGHVNWEWQRIEKRGKITGNPNILHVFNAERADQYRGVPFLAPVIHTLKQVTRYTEAEIMAAVINSMFTLFIQTENGEDISGFGGEDSDEEMYAQTQDECRLGSGLINYLKNGEKVVPIQSTHPSSTFDGFIQSMTNIIGASLEISPEVLLKKFSNNFSASKGALNETWQSFKKRRVWFVADFCQQVYELWFCEAVSKGRIHAPGFFTDPLIKSAYTNATWTGPAQSCLDPVKEVNAAVTRIANGLSNHTDECAAMNGSDFDENIRALEDENEKLAKANIYASPKQEHDSDYETEDSEE